MVRNWIQWIRITRTNWRNRKRVQESRQGVQVGVLAKGLSGRQRIDAARRLRDPGEESARGRVLDHLRPVRANCQGVRLAADRDQKLKWILLLFEGHFEFGEFDGGQQKVSALRMCKANLGQHSKQIQWKQIEPTAWPGHVGGHQLVQIVCI